MGGTHSPEPRTPERSKAAAVPSTPFKTPKRDTHEARLRGLLTPLSSIKRGQLESSLSLVDVFRQLVLRRDLTREVQVVALNNFLANVWQAAKQAEASLDLSDDDTGAQDLHDSFRKKVRDKLTPSKDEPDDQIRAKRQAVEDNIDIVLELFVAVEGLTGNAATNVIWSALKTSGDGGEPCAELQAYRAAYAQLTELLEAQQGHLEAAGNSEAAAAITAEIATFAEKNKVREVIGNICTRLYISLQNALLIIAQPDAGAELPEWGQQIERVIEDGPGDIKVSADIEAVVNTLCFELIKAEIAAHTAEMRARIRELQAALGQSVDREGEVEEYPSPAASPSSGSPSKYQKYQKQQASNSHVGLWFTLLWLLIILIAALCAVFVKGLASNICSGWCDLANKIHNTHASSDGLNAIEQTSIVAGTAGVSSGIILGGVYYKLEKEFSAASDHYNRLPDADSASGTPPGSRPPSRVGAIGEHGGPLSPDEGEGGLRRRVVTTPPPGTSVDGDMFDQSGTGYSPERR